MRTDSMGVVFLFILVIAAVLLAETLSFGFMSDDFVLVHRIRTEGFFTSWGGEGGSSFFRPVVVASYLTDDFIWGLRPFGYHLTNVLWHICCSFLVYLLALQLFSSRRMAVLAGLLFLLLGSHTESVSWVSGRTDLIAAAFGLASTVLFLRGSFVSLLFLVLALVSKESSIALPAVWMLLMPWAKGNRALRRILASGTLLALVYILFRFMSGDVSGNLTAAGGEMAPLAVMGNVFRYFLRVFIPPLPGSFRPFLESHSLVLAVFALLLSAAVLIPLLRKTLKKRQEIFLFVSMFLVSLAPVSFMSVSLFDTRSERFLYLPGVFAVLALVKWAFSVHSERRATILLIAFVLLQGGFFYRSNRNWKRAGEICLEVISSGDCSNAPDNHRGAYVFRNGCREAMELFSE